MLNKKAVSGIVVTVILIALVISISAVVFTVTKKSVEEKIKKTESCGLNLLDKLSLNPEYACYDSSTGEAVFSVNRGDIALDSIIVALETETETTTFQLNEGEKKIINRLYSYSKERDLQNKEVEIPPKNSGRTYIGTGFSGKVIGIKLAPVINGQQCEVVDSLSGITPCGQTSIFRTLST